MPQEVPNFVDQRVDHLGDGSKEGSLREHREQDYYSIAQCYDQTQDPDDKPKLSVHIS